MGTPVDPTDRYHRQTLLPQVGVEGQSRLAGSHAVVVGVGALGTVASELLARAGVGRLTLIDRDIVEWTNLHRQTLFTEADAAGGVPKAQAAAARLGAINSEITIDPAVRDLNARSVGVLLPAGTPGLVVLDCTDNFETRYLLNDACVGGSLPLVYGGAVGTRGMTLPVLAGVGDTAPCLRCVFPDAPEPGSQPTCDTAGVLGALTAMVGARQAMLALRVLATPSSPPPIELWSCEAWPAGPGSPGDRTMDLSGARDPSCPCCGMRRFEFLAEDAVSEALLCGRDAVQVAPVIDADIDLRSLAARLAPYGVFKAGPFALRGIIDGERAESADEPCSLTVFADGRAIVGGTTRPERARAIYARYVGG